MTKFIYRGTTYDNADRKAVTNPGANKGLVYRGVQNDGAKNVSAPGAARQNMFYRGQRVS